MSNEQKFFEVIPPGTKIGFVKNQKFYVLISVVLVVLSLGMLGFNTATRGTALNFGIDFQGGSQVRLALTKDVPIDDVRGALEDLGYEGSSVVGVPDHDNEVLIRVKETVTVTEEGAAACEAALGKMGSAKLAEQGFYHPPETSKIFLKFESLADYSEVENLLNEAGCEGRAEPGDGKQDEFPVSFTLTGIGNKLVEQMDETFGEDTVDHIVSSETVGAKVGNELKVDGAMAMGIAIGLIFLFVLLRFDLSFAPGGIVALTHDAIIVIGCFALTWKEFNLQTIAALLTIIGYSINDTIVVFDRIRERVSMDRDADIKKTTNLALNETLSRTVLTSGTTMLVVAATWILGSGPIKDFAFALFIGVIVGTYSSLCVAAPVFLWVNDRLYKGKGHLRALDKKEREGTGTLLGGTGDGQQGGSALGGSGTPGIEGAGPQEAPQAGPPGERKTRRRRRRPT